MKNYKIATIAGDGIGKEISVESKKIMNWINNKTDIKVDVIEESVGGESIDKFNTPLTNEALDKISS